MTQEQLGADLPTETSRSAKPRVAQAQSIVLMRITLEGMLSQVPFISIQILGSI